MGVRIGQRPSLAVSGGFVGVGGGGGLGEEMATMLYVQGFPLASCFSWRGSDAWITG